MTWPAAMKRPDAARYCGLSVSEFEQEIAAERLPNGFRLGKTEHWSKARLDDALDKIAGGQNNDWRKQCGLYA